jgi:hypothetical protein
VFSVSQLNREISVYMAFIDFGKACGTVIRIWLWETAFKRRHRPTAEFGKNHEVPLYTHTTIKVNTETKTIENFRGITEGIKQGCPLLPVLFNLYSYIDEVFKARNSNVEINSFIEETALNTLLFAGAQVMFVD